MKKIKIKKKKVAVLNSTNNTSAVSIDWEVVFKLLESHCSGVEVASQLGIHENTLYQRCRLDLKMEFRELKQIKNMSGKAILRKTQFEKAVVDKDNTMLVWLGKQLLAQKEKAEQDINVTGGVTIVFKPANENS